MRSKIIPIIIFIFILITPILEGSYYHEKAPAERSEKCFELLQKKKLPDLIPLDIIMPDIDGWAVFGRLRANSSWKDIPIIFVTARTDELAEHVDLLIAEDYIKKPIEIMELKTRIDNVFEKLKKK